MANKLTILIVVICLLVALYFIYNQPGESEFQKITVMMPFIPQPQWMVYYTAKGMGYYEEEGLDVEIQYSTKGSAGPVEQLAAGNVDFILADAESLVIAQAQGIDIVALYPIEPANVFYVISEKEANIKNPADLAGKTVGIISSASGAYPNLQVILHSANLNIDDVELISAGTAVVPSFLEGQFDAISCHLSQRVLVEEEIGDIDVIKASDYTNMSSGHIITTRHSVENKNDITQRFLRATKKGLEYSVNNVDEVIDIYISFNPDAASKKELSLLLWNEFIKEFNYEQDLPSLESESHWQMVQDTVYDIGIIDDKMDTSLFYTNEFNL